MNKLSVMLGLLVSTVAWAKLPAPSDEAKAKATEAAAKAAHASKVDAYKTCLSAEKAAAHYLKAHPSATKPTSPPACTDPGAYVPPVPAALSPAAKPGSGKP